MNIPALPQLAQDKANHAVYGVSIYLVVKLLTRNKEIAFLVAVVFGALKELLWDKLLHKGTPDVYDYIATVAFPAMIYTSDSL